MKTAVRILMWTHFVYLLLLPTLAVVSAVFMFRDDLWTVVLIAGFPPVLMYSLFLANGYTLPNSLPVALFVVLAIPLQIAVSILVFGQGSIWLFFSENAAVEIGAFVLGVMFVALRNRSAEYKPGCFVVLLLLATVLFVGGIVPFLASVFYGYGGLNLWLILFISSFAAAFWAYTGVYRKLTTAFVRKKEAQNLEMRFDSAIASRLFGVPRNVELLSPLWGIFPQSTENKLVWVLGFIAMFLPIAAGMIAAAIIGRF